MDEPGATSHPPAAPPAMIRGGILVLIALAYLPVLRFGFVLDDGWTIISNGFLRYPSHLSVLWGGRAASLGIPDPFRPTLIVFDTLAYGLLGLHAKAHHLLSVGLHLGVCVLLDANLARRGAPAMVRYATLAIFGLLGIHAEAVTVISFREDLLAAALGLAAVWAATPQSNPSPRAAASITSVLCMAAATATKLSAVPLPVFAWLWWTWPRWRPASDLGPRARSCGLLVLGVSIGVLTRWQISGQFLPYATHSPSLSMVPPALLDQWASGLAITTNVLVQTILPFGLCPEYTPEHRTFASPLMLGWAGAFALVVIGALILRRRRPALIIPVMLLAWLVLWLPTSNVIALPNPRADRYAYLPSIPICIALAALFEQAVTRAPNRSTVIFAMGAAFIVLHGSLGMTACRSYVSNSTLWRVASERSPDSSRAHAMNGIMMLSRLDRRPVPDPDLLAATERACQRALSLNPYDAHPHLCFARLRTIEKSWSAAYDHLSQALALAAVRRGTIEATQLELLPDVLLAESSIDLRRAVLSRSHELIQRYPYSPTVFEAVGRALHRLGFPYQAGMAYRAAYRRRPERAITIARRIELAIDLGDLAGANALFTQSDMLRNKLDESERTALIARVRLLSRLHAPSLVPSTTP